MAYRVLGLPLIRRSFPIVKTMAHNLRATVIENTNSGFVELCNRTEYSAYSERCFLSKETKGNLTMERLNMMSLREFCETISFKWILNKRTAAHAKINQGCAGNSFRSRNNEDANIRQDNGSDVNCNEANSNDENVLRSDETSKNDMRSSRVKWRCRDKRSGHWLMWEKSKPTHIKSSTLLYTDLASRYAPDDNYSIFFDMPSEKRNQLKRAYQEIIFYLPWQDDPDKTLLSPDVIEELATDRIHSNDFGRYSLKQMHEYFEVYMKKMGRRVDSAIWKSIGTTL